MRSPIVFTDLDGTLLDHATYSWEPALPALSLLRERQIPLVFCSSKTRAEIEHYRRELGNLDPFISENGGGIFIPDGYFDLSVLPLEPLVTKTAGWAIIRLGAPYLRLRQAIRRLREEGFALTGFGDMTIAEVAAKMRVSKMTVYRLVHNGELPAVRVGRSFRVTEDDVDEYLRKSFFNAG